MSKQDLTRWNRAGLRRLRYVDGNAVTYLERLRAALAEAYTGPGDSLPRWEELATRHPVPARETDADREARLLAQYGDSRRDHGWEILRAFARSTHVLTEHIDAYANETYLRTATQWDSVARLVQLLDARPAPPSSARTDLAIFAKAAGVLPAGFQVKNVPQDGGAPAVFETAVDIEVDPALNALRPAEWNRSQEAMLYTAQAGGHVTSFPLEADAEPPTVGEIAVLDVAASDGVSDPEGFGVQVAQVLPGSALLLGQAPPGGGARAFKRWRACLHSDAQLVQTPRLGGSRVVILTPEHNLSAGRSSVTWYDGGWKSAKVMEVDGDRVRLSTTSMPDTGAALYLMVTAARQSVGGIDRVVVPTDRGGGARVWSPDYTDTTGWLLEEPETGDDGETFTVYQYAAGVDALLYVAAGSEPVAIVEESAPTGLVLGGTVKDVRQGDWIVSAGETLQAVRIEAVTELEDDTVIETVPQVADLRAPVHLNFSRVTQPQGHDRNTTLAFDADNPSDQVTRMFTAPQPWPEALSRGRKVVIATEGLAHGAQITAIDPSGAWLEVSPPVPGTEKTQPQVAPPLLRWTTLIHANVVTADHGERQPRKTLGSGDATQSRQRFEPGVEDLSFTTDPLMPAGVRAAIEIDVEDRRWRQVGNLRDSGPTDADYEVRLADDQSLSVHFGDGRNGRRLPTGTDNIRYSWRKGAGATGNLRAGALQKIVQPHPLVDKVVQPLASAGGTGTEGLASLRETAATGLLTLGRAVSVSDFGKLAARNAQVLQARSRQMSAGTARGDRVQVVVVPAGGRMGTLGDEVRTFLQNNALPGVQIDVVAYVPLPLSLRAVLRIDTAAFDPDKVALVVRTALTETYALERTRLGAPLYRSQLLAVVESVAGVENATVEIEVSRWAAIVPPPLLTRSPGLSVRAVKPRYDQMIHFDPDVSDITIDTETYSL